MLLEALGHDAVAAGHRVAWFSLESLGVLVRRHRADDSVTRAITRILRAGLIIIDKCRPGDYADRRVASAVVALILAGFLSWERLGGSA